MVDLTRPLDLKDRVWASDGVITVPTEAEVEEGWEVGEEPPAEIFNYTQNRTDRLLSYILQKGVPQWDTNEDYIAVDSFASRAGSIYRAETNHSGEDPLLETGDWVKVLDASGGLSEADRPDLLARANHTGVQAISTVTDLQTSLDAKEVITNKATNFSAPNNTTYPTTQAVADLVSGSGGASTLLMTSTITNVITSYTELSAGVAYEVSSSGGAYTIVLPATPDIGTWVWLYDIDGSWDIENITLNRNSQLLEGLAEDMALDVKYWNGFTVFVGGSYGWVLKGA